MACDCGGSILRQAQDDIGAYARSGRDVILSLSKDAPAAI
jgi:hypothetical protein